MMMMTMTMNIQTTKLARWPCTRELLLRGSCPCFRVLNALRFHVSAVSCFSRSLSLLGRCMRFHG